MEGQGLVSRSWQESKLLWRVAFPAVLVELLQFSIGFVTASFVGHLGVVELAAVTAVESILEGFAYGVLVRSLELSFGIVQFRPAAAARRR